MNKHFLLICSMLVALPAYGQQAPETAPLPLPPAPQAQTATAPLPATAANVEVVAPEPFLEALISAYNTNPRLKAQREALKATDEGVAVALSGFRPTAIAEYDRGRARSRTATNWGYDDSRNRALSVRQPLFSGGQTVYGYQSAKQQVKSARAELMQVEQNVLFDTVDAYSNLYEKQTVLALSQNNVDVLKHQLDATQARFDVGELTRTDIAQAQARFAQSIADLQRAEAELKTAEATFQKVVGYTPQNLLPDSMIPELPSTLAEATQLAQQQNPALVSIRHTQKAAEYAVDQRIGTILPEVSLDGTMSRTSGSGFLSNFDNDAVTVNVTVPLYQSGAEYARVREAKNIHQQTKYQEMDIKNEVVEAVTSAFEDYKASLAVINSTASAVEAADIARAGVREENEFGVRTILDVLDAEQELFRNRVNLVRAERNKVVQAYRLLASIGKLTATDLGLPVEVYDPTEHYDDVKWLPVGF